MDLTERLARKYGHHFTTMKRDGTEAQDHRDFSRDPLVLEAINEIHRLRAALRDKTRP